MLSFDSASIDRGAGDDLMRGAAEGADIFGGDGGDTIDLYGFAASTEVYGGEGNDSLSGELRSGDSATLAGGSGNDTIDAREMENVQALGGEGDDLVLVGPRGFGGTGYIVSAKGGDGDDTIRFDGPPSDEGNPQFRNPIQAEGGNGADLFVLTTTEGGGIPGDQTPPGTDVETVGLMTIEDCEPGTDTIEVEATTLDDDFTVTEARLEEDTDAGTTPLTLSYEQPTEAPRDMAVTINATGLTSLADIEFIGDEVPTLAPAA